MAELVLARPERLPVGPVGRRGMGQWGVGALVASEAALFGYLLFSYYYVGASALPGWLLEPAPKMWPALPNTLLLLASSGAAWFGEKGVERGNRAQALAGLIGAFAWARYSRACRSMNGPRKATASARRATRRSISPPPASTWRMSLPG